MKKNSWFEVDKEGLRRILAKRGKSFAIFELVQNAWDTNAKNIEIDAEAVSRNEVELLIRDNDPTGFAELSDAFTLFAPSKKLDDPEKRGRFNLGEKLVLSICKEANLYTTTGTVRFKKDGARVVDRDARSRLEIGSVFKALLDMTGEELRELEAGVKRLIVPEGKTLTFNDTSIPRRTPIANFETTLPTIAANADGEMIRTARRTRVDVYKRLDGADETSIFEMGIPVVDTGDLYDIDVQQKVPVSLSRDNVPPGYLRKLRTLVLNETSGLLDPEQVNDTWVRDALEHGEIEPETVREVITKRFGEKRVIFDPSDLEANNIATSRGYTVIPSRALSKATWSNVREAKAALPAGRVTPSPKPFSPDGRPMKLATDVTDGMLAFERYVGRIGKFLALGPVEVQFAVDPGWNFTAAYGPKSGSNFGGRLIVNVLRLGKAWFEGTSTEMLALLIHEFAHHFESNHLSHNFHDVTCDLGAKLAFAGPDFVGDYYS